MKQSDKIKNRGLFRVSCIPKEALEDTGTGKVEGWESSDDVFRSRASAIREAHKLAAEYPGSSYGVHTCTYIAASDTTVVGEEV